MACRAGIRLLALSFFLGFVAACSHTPAERSTTGERENTTEREMVRGSVYFSIHAPGADSVQLIIMRAHALTPAASVIKTIKESDDIWTADLDLIPGEYRYFFVVDGQVTVEGGTGRIVQDDFGGETRVLTVGRTPEGKLKIF